MTADLRAAAQRALVALEYHTQQTRPIEQTEHAIKALMEALAFASSPVVKDSLTTQAPEGDERAAFEAWAGERGGNITRHHEGGERYASATVQGWWRAWQARAARSQSLPDVQPKGMLSDEQKGARWKELLPHSANYTSADWFEAGACFAESAYRAQSPAPVDGNAFGHGYDTGYEAGRLAAQAPAVRPLTQQAVVDAFCKLPHPVQFVSAFDAGVRFAERHYGIVSDVPVQPIEGEKS